MIGLLCQLIAITLSFFRVLLPRFPFLFFLSFSFFFFLFSFQFQVEELEKYTVSVLVLMKFIETGSS